MNDILTDKHAFCLNCKNRFIIRKQDKNYFYVYCNCEQYKNSLGKFGDVEILKIKGETI